VLDDGGLADDAADRDVAGLAEPVAGLESIS
jgi:hypothetical protein